MIIEYVNSFFSTENFIENALHLIDTIVGIVLLIIVIKGVKIFDKFKEKRYNATWDFYTNFGTYLYRLRLGLDIRRSNAAKYLYNIAPKPELISLKDEQEIKKLRKLADDFLNFLSTGTGQIPAIDDFNEWDNNRLGLIMFLDTMCYAGLRLDFIDEDARDSDKRENLKKKIEEILSVIDFFEEKIKKVKSDLKKEIDGA